jgi:hypothetical protein
MTQDLRQPEAMKQWGQVVARAWSDETFKQRLLSDPRTVLAEAGLPVPRNSTVQVHETTPTQLHLVLPPPPDELSDAELDQMAGGVTQHKDNPTQSPVSQPIALLFVAPALLFIPPVNTAGPDQ